MTFHFFLQRFEPSTGRWESAADTVWGGPYETQLDALEARDQANLEEKQKNPGTDIQWRAVSEQGEILEYHTPGVLRRGSVQLWLQVVLVVCIVLAVSLVGSAADVQPIREPASNVLVNDQNHWLEWEFDPADEVVHGFFMNEQGGWGWTFRMGPDENGRIWDQDYIPWWHGDDPHDSLSMSSPIAPVFRAFLNTRLLDPGEYSVEFYESFEETGALVYRWDYTVVPEPALAGWLCVPFLLLRRIASV